MPLDIHAPEVSFALGIVRQAAQLARRIQTGMAMMNLTKSDCSPATVADFAIQALVAEALERSFPNMPLVAEERSAELRKSETILGTVTRFVSETRPDAQAEDVCRWIDRGASEPGGRFWVLDPIDGTKGYLRRGQYAVAFALLRNAEVQLGVLGCPNLGEHCVPDSCGAGVLVIAQRGQGAWQAPLNEEKTLTPMQVSSCRNPVEARLLRSYEAAHTNVAETDRFVRMMGLRVEPVLMDSQAKYAVLAAGNGEILIRLLSPEAPDYSEKIWDHAAGSLIVEEAGGRVSDLDGRALDFAAGRKLTRNRGEVVTNGYLHDAVLGALAKLGLST
jgi:3'(2'), 5'-bisphosphate nucleotidase